MKTLIPYFIFSFLFVACNNTNSDKKLINTEETDISQVLKDTLLKDTIKIQVAEIDSVKELPRKEILRPRTNRQIYLRESDGVSIAKLNGEPIVIQLELSSKSLVRNPDTIKNQLAEAYLVKEPMFPRSIADNFENGTSTERISYPKLYYSIELFEDEYSAKPYKIMQYTVRKEKEKIIVE